MIGLNLNPTVGALEIGITTSAFLFGVTTVQTYVYHQQFPNDPRMTKILVAIVWLLELAHAVSVSHGFYILTIAEYGEPLTLLRSPAPLGFDTCLFFSSAICLLAQCFFARRVRIVTQKKLVPIICFILAIVRFIGSFVLAAESYGMLTLTKFEDQWTWLITAILVDGACVDVMIAVSLCANLIEQRPYVSIRTVRMIDRLVLWAIQTGLLTSMAAVTMTICFLTMKYNFIWLSVYMFLSRLFANSLLASLNARSNLRKMGGFDMAEPSARPTSGTAGTTSDPSIQFKTMTVTIESRGPRTPGPQQVISLP